MRLSKIAVALWLLVGQGSLNAQTIVGGLGINGLELMSARSFSHRHVPSRLARPENFRDFAVKSASAAINLSSQCGMTWLDSTEEPRLPSYVDLVSVNRLGYWTSYYRAQSNVVSESHIFENPNGSYQHSIFADSEKVVFRTPYASPAAYAIREVVNGVETVKYVCGTQTVSQAAFARCVDVNFVELIARQLCRYAH